MKKSEEEALLRNLELVVDGLTGSLENQKEISKLLARIVGVIGFLYKWVSAISFIISLLVLRIFFWTPVREFLDRISHKWTSLSEGYQLLILGFLTMVIAGIIAHVVGSLLLSKIKSVLKRE